MKSKSSKLVKESDYILIYTFVSVFQIEKVLQQGEISDCAEPYVTLRECDSAKVLQPSNVLSLSSWTAGEHAADFVLALFNHALLV